MDLSTPLQYVKGIGPVRAKILAAKGLLTVSDLLYYAPFRYEDRRNMKTVAQLAPGEKAAVLGWVRGSKLSRVGRKMQGLFEASLWDGTGGLLHARWFHGERYAKTLVPDTRVAVFGKVEFDRFNGDRLMIQPDIEILSNEDEDDECLHIGRIVPVYEAAGKISTRVFRVLIHRILKEVSLPEDALPPSVRERIGLPDLSTAIQHLHNPPQDTDLQLLNEFRTPAQYRLIFDEFFWLECGLAFKKTKAKAATGIAFQITDGVREQIKRMLPFKPTGAQRRVVQEIADDMKQPHPMNRLLQGDVGSGKTIVAAEAAIIAIENKYQVAVLAPTEILATQHYGYFKRLLEKLGYVIALLTGSMTSREKQQVKQLVAGGLVHVVVGTHALIQEDVEFANLGLAIVDEQHRFGVRQRWELFKKGKDEQADVLVMTATPIPRTLALTIYGDLDVSIIDELPPGRKPIITQHVPESAIETVYSFVAQEIGLGRQAYVVYPVVEESETAAVKAAEGMYQHLSKAVFPKVRVGLLHGRLPAAEKEAVMASFQSGEIKILVSTTVIEVGVDVPNASVMVIEQAERFGLAQIHQLRGRVGRGSHQSYCVLVTGKLNEIARERIRTLIDSSDGFYIAEMDMKLRGPGEFFGTKQSGIPGLRLADLFRDSDILEQARAEAQALLQRPENAQEVRAVAHYIQENWQRRYGLVQVG
ncbi:MAG: ATP-dependent DNA helicase RecG [Acidobacteriaceae bacterium]|nr:ATP-dependent DNA helicase RecG [Acidobacteriaceae bacterium]MBV9305747.1 ATP-dependent DNA helicase RecG [Acidobacteriaceae bacterium]